MLLVRTVASSSADCIDRLAVAVATKYDEATGRPTFGEFLICNVDAARLARDLETFVHEAIHVLVRCRSPLACVALDTCLRPA